MKLAIFVLVALLGCMSVAVGKDSTPAAGAEWSYKGDTGPQRWEALDPAYAECSEGNHQSPIDLIDLEEDPNLTALQFKYHKTALVMENDGNSFSLRYQRGSYMFAEGHMFELKKIRFHTPSEHTIRGIRFPMEAELIHETKGGRKAIVSVLFVRGAENSWMKHFWSRIPMAKGTSSPSQERTIATALLPEEDRSYYAYKGSISHPPCTEGVHRYVFQVYRQASGDQISFLQRIFGDNIRPQSDRREHKVLKSPAKPYVEPWPEQEHEALMAKHNEEILEARRKKIAESRARRATEKQAAIDRGNLDQELRAKVADPSIAAARAEKKADLAQMEKTDPALAQALEKQARDAAYEKKEVEQKPAEK